MSGVLYPLLVTRADAKQEIIDEVAGYIGKIHTMGAYVLVRVYIPPIGLGFKSPEGIEIVTSERQQGESNYQGKVGLVLDMGPAAFREDARHIWGERVPKLHDWVTFNVGNGHACDIGAKATTRGRFRIFEDVHLMMIVDDPALVY